MLWNYLKRITFIWSIFVWRKRNYSKLWPLPASKLLLNEPLLYIKSIFWSQQLFNKYPRCFFSAVVNMCTSISPSIKSKYLFHLLLFLLTFVKCLWGNYKKPDKMKCRIEERRITAAKGVDSVHTTQKLMLKRHCRRLWGGGGFQQQRTIILPKKKTS